MCERSRRHEIVREAGMRRLMLLFCLVTSSANAEIDPLIYTQAFVSCERWQEVRAPKSSFTTESYLVGLLDGMSVGSKSEFWRAKPNHLATEQVLVWMDVYCGRNPTDTVLDGARKLFEEHTER